jgi:bacillithiol biosynthesis cysteine-adding enzyme BshC
MTIIAKSPFHPPTEKTDCMIANASRSRHIKADYLQGNPELKPFYKYPIQNPDFGQIIKDKNFSSENRNTLVQALRSQYKGFDLSEKLKYNIDALLDDHTYTVTTGHQLGLMGGPLFTLYKILSTIRLAEWINDQYDDSYVVPVFWIHTEDHDFEEINHFFEGFGKKKSYPGKFDSATGFHILEESIRSLIPENFDGKLAEAWQPNQSLAVAMRRFFHDLLGHEGLVILDPMDKGLKEIMRPVIQEEVFHELAHNKVGELSEELEKAGYKLQVHPRGINMFYLDAQGRNRIEWNGSEFVAVDRELTWSREEMQALINNEPEKFSPNVCLRPLYQEMILPNLAYFGGWGELSYWVQLKSLFEKMEVNFPMLLPRFSATLFSEKYLSTWKELGFEKEDILRDTHDLFKEFIPKLWDDSQFNSLVAEMLETQQRLEEYIKQDISSTLARSAAALKVKTENFTDNLYKKAHRILRHKHPQPFEKIREIKRAINPDRMVQERIWSLAVVDGDLKEFVKWLKPHVNPLDFEHQVLVLNE